MIWELIKDNILFVENIDDWRSAIRLAADPLLTKEVIEPRYIDAMISMCEKYNSYIVLNDYFAMPHASSDHGVNRLGVSLLISKDEINFSGKPAHLVLVIAPENNFSHIDLLKNVAQYFGDVKFIMQLAKTSSLSEVSETVREFYGIEVVN